MKNNSIIKINEEELKHLVKKSITEILNEIGDTHRGQYMLGRVNNRFRRNDAENKKYQDMTAERMKPEYLDDFYNGRDDERSGNINNIKYHYELARKEDDLNLSGKFFDWFQDNEDIYQELLNSKSNDFDFTLMDIIHIYEKEVLGYELRQRQIMAIYKRMRSWWLFHKQHTNKKE
jgi:hypothetical protein